MHGVKMMDNLNVSNLLNIYENEISKNVKNKRKLYDFEINKMQYIEDIIKMLKNGLVGHNHYNIFLIYEPKCRLVMSLSVKDKVINHFITKYVLENSLSKYLDERNVATRKGMGTDYAIKLVKKYINKLKCKYDNFYVLKLDISKYFYSVDHDVLKKLMVDKLGTYEYDIISKIIDSTNKNYINETINKVKKNNDIPLYEYNKGLPIGNMTSQFLSIYYLYKLDHFIVNDLHLKYYVRYMDDFIVLDNDIKKLKEAKKIITDKLEKEYKLKINEKKTWINNIKYGFNFLGYTYKVIDKKTIIKIKRSNIDKIKKRIKEVKYLFNTGKMGYYNVFCSIMTYSNSYKYADDRKIKRLIDKYLYNEK